jgi:hypothetical protein
VHLAQADQRRGVGVVQANARPEVVVGKRVTIPPSPSLLQMTD